MGHFSFFRKKNKDIKESTILWEDDYLMIEVLSRDNWEHAVKENKRINEFSQDHFDGNGFTDITEVQDGIKKTLELSIALTEFLKTIEEAGMKRIPIVLYDGKPIEDTKTIVYGESKNGLYIEHKNGLVKDIWLAFYNRSALPRSVFDNGLKAIGDKYDMIMVDWNHGDVIDLTNETEIKEYLKN